MKPTNTRHQRTPRPNTMRLALTSAILVALTPMVMAADATPAPTPDPQAAPAPTPSDQNRANAAAKTETQSLEGIVVTGTATAGGVKKLDASFIITAANAEQIKEANPKSTADILKISPGLWPESSGGQTGANIEIAGFPGGGDAPFFTMMVQGTPMYGMSSLSFMDSSSFVRLDDTVERVEIIQTGPGVLYGAGQMGATANFLLKQGTSEPAGSIAVTYGNEGLYRVDGFFGGKLADGWYGSIGGFWRQSDGVRSPQFKADDGYQLTGTLTHDLDNGSIMLWARTLQDKNQFMVPTPLIEDQHGNFSKYPGFDALTDTYGSKAIQHMTLVNPAGGTEQANLANGRGGNLNFFGGNYDAEFNGWQISDKFVWSGGQLNTNALFSGPNPKPLGYFLYGCNYKSALSNEFCAAGDGNTLNYPLSQNVSYNGASSLDQSVIQQGWWFIQKDLRNLNNDFRVSKEIFDGNTLTAGVYLAHYTDDDNWSLGNPMLMTNTPNASPITLSYVQGGNTYYVTNPQGILSYGQGYNIIEHGVGNNKAFYLADSWRLWDKWLLDVGGRVENISVNQRTCNQKNVNLDGNPYTLWDNNAQICDGTYTTLHYDKTHPAFTAGLNYEIFDNMSAYLRVSAGGHFNDFDNGIRGTGGDFAPMQKIRNFEYGFKWQTDWVYADLSAYHRQFTGLTYGAADNNNTPLDCNGKPTAQSGLPQCTAIYGADTKGFNGHVVLTPIENFKVDALVALMYGHYSHQNGFAIATDVNGHQFNVDLNGQPLQRQPKQRYMITPSYKFVINDDFNIMPFVTYTFVGQRFEDQTGLAPLGTYHTWDFGIVANYGKNWQFRVQGTNLTNEIGLTEGNARVAGVPTGPGGVLLARSIEGREINFQAKYQF
ncbi:MAG: TonB-dependent receptor [Proteobacteria bacterium]|uniref:TonB-dependent receptor n=1 Tax=Rudaea sp. TaxID=2136325 RepID=UPI00321FCFF6|nr:TonB-dependent receptor [Pseudomonadota bacterium]